MAIQKKIHRPAPVTKQPQAPVTKKAAPVRKWDPRKSNRYFVLFFFLFAVILYGNTVINKWAVDDTFVTHNDVARKGFKAIREIFTTSYVSQSGNIGAQSSDYRPIVKLTFALEYQLWGEKVHRSHAINLLLYFWISTLLFFILRRLLKNYNILFPFLITVVFMAHPVHTEVVASLKNRDELLAFLCALGGLHFFLRYAERKKIIYTVYAMIVLFIGYLCKSSILPFLVVYPLVLYFFTDMNPRKFIYIVLSVLGVFLLAYYGPRMFLPSPVKTKSFIENPLFFEKNLWMRLGTGLLSLWFYLKILIWPHPLVFYYGYNMIPVTGPGNIWALLSLGVHFFMLAFALMKFREKHILSFAILYYFITIAMFSNILAPVVGIVGERFVFAASLGFCLAVVFFIFKLFKTDPKSLTIEFNERAKIIVLIFLILIPYVATTVYRNRQWRSLFDLYRADIKYLNNSVKANIEFGEFLMTSVYQDPNYQQDGKVNQFKQQIMIGHFKRALELYPSDYKTLNDLGTVYINFTENPDSAFYFLRNATALNPNLQPAWVNLGLLYRKKGNLDSAKFCYERVLRINPDELNAVFKIADIYFDQHNFAKAFEMTEEVMKAHPDLDVPYFNMGFYHLALRDTTKCIQYWEEAAKRNPSYEVCVDLSIVLKAKGEYEKANYYYSLGMEDAEKQKKSGEKRD
jgi:protein O-mannosyl-transferase